MNASTQVKKHPDRRRIGVFAPGFPPAFRGGGPIRSIEALIATTPDRFEPMILTSNRDLGELAPLPVEPDVWIPEHTGFVRYVNTSKPTHILKGMISLRQQRPLALYFNGFFDPRFTILPLLLWRVAFWGRPIRIIAPRGEFGAGALSRRPTKKLLYITAFRLLRLEQGVIWHATAPHEVEDIRARWGKGAQIVLRENDTRLPSVAEEVPELAGHGNAAFLGRVVEHKGLAIILEALRAVAAPFRLDVYGAEEDANYVIHCRKVAKTLPDGVEVTFHGAVASSQVRTILGQHDVLLMPTAGENFGHVIAEALSVSCPVFATPHTPWSSVLGGGGGVVVPNREPDSWSAIISSWQASSPEVKRAMRERARSAYGTWADRTKLPHLFELTIG